MLITLRGTRVKFRSTQTFQSPECGSLSVSQSMGGQLGSLLPFLVKSCSITYATNNIHQIISKILIALQTGKNAITEYDFNTANPTVGKGDLSWDACT